MRHKKVRDETARCYGLHEWEAYVEGQGLTFRQMHRMRRHMEVCLECLKTVDLLIENRAPYGETEVEDLGFEEMPETMLRLRALTDRLSAGILERIDGVIVNGDPEHRIPGTTNLSFPGIEGESIVLGLDMEGVAVSTGSACTTDAVGPSHVLQAMGVAPNVAQGSVRFGLGRETLEEDVEHVLAVLPGIVDRLRAMSPFSSPGS